MRRFLSALVLAFPCLDAALAESPRAVRSLPGYVCMRLNITPEQAVDPKVGVPIRDAPSASARVVAYAANTMIVQDPQQPTSGFLRVLRFNGEHGWIEAAYLRPWSNPFAPGSRCTPAIMSDGKPGFGTVH